MKIILKNYSGMILAVWEMDGDEIENPKIVKKLIKELVVTMEANSHE